MFRKRFENKLFLRDSTIKYFTILKHKINVFISNT